MKHRYAIVGTGSRAQLYLWAIAGPHRSTTELVAWTDTNPGRIDFSERRLAQDGIPAPLRFAPDQLGAVIAEHGIDRVIVTSPDFTHAGHVVAALDAGADVIVEKPLTTTAEGVRAIAEAVERSGRSVTTTFNYRYSPRNSELKRVVADGEIGEVTSVHFEWLLDTAHGADYFRRWHRDKANSGGLLVHKSSHHFDLVNWWIADAPVRVFASGGLRFYGAENAAKRGLGHRPERGTTDDPARDAFSLDLRSDPGLRGLYLENEQFDGYLRDRDVFDPGITIEDNLSLVVDYARGASMSYSLNAHSPWEGYVVGDQRHARPRRAHRGRARIGAARRARRGDRRPERATRGRAGGSRPPGLRAARRAAALRLGARGADPGRRGRARRRRRHPAPRPARS